MFSSPKKPGYSLIFVLLVMTTIMIIAASTVENTRERVAYYREMEGSVMAKLAAQSAAELGVVAMKDYEAGYETDQENSFCVDSNKDGDCETWGDYEVISRATESGENFYVPIFGSGTAGNSDDCSVLHPIDDPGHSCNWNKMLVNQNVSIPLYVDEGSGLLNPLDLGMNSWSLRIRTPCSNGSLEDDCEGGDRYVMDDTEDTAEVDFGGDTVILWELSGEDGSGGGVALLPDDSKLLNFDETGYERHAPENTEIYEYQINTEAVDDYIVLEGTLSSSELCINSSPSCLDLSTLTQLELRLNIVTPLLDSNRNAIPFLEWQFVTDSSLSSADTKAVIFGRGYHEGMEGTFYFPFSVTRSTTEENINIYTLSN